MNTKESFNSFFKTQLNAKQQEAVEQRDGVLLVCAGAGSGKTRIITSRIAHLILHHGIAPQEIVALTFTNKAAKEMKERVHSFLGSEYELPYVGTFHSYCLRLLKSHPQATNMQHFSLMDDQDQTKIIRSLLQKHSSTKKITPKQLLSFISRIKNSGSIPSFKDSWGEQKMFLELYHMYEEEKTKAHCLDFDDLLLITLKLFTTNPEFKKTFLDRVRHLLVDEYQDTNHVQHDLLKAIALEEKTCKLDSLCVVGDEDQSIYSWRGATVSNILEFKQDFNSAQSITIDQNYRSAQPILHIANEVIKHNLQRNPKKLWSDRPATDRARLLCCGSGYQEGEVVAYFLSLQKNLKSCAILYRSHAQSRTIEEALMRHRIPYKIIGGIQFYDRLEIKDLISYMRLVCNPFDRLAFSRVINSPSRSLGEKFEEQFYNLWDLHPFFTFKEVAQLLIDEQQLTRIKDEALKQFLMVFDNLYPHSDPSYALDEILHRTGYYSYLQESFEKEEAHIKKENIKELVNGIAYFETTGDNTTLEKFLEEVSLLQEQMDKRDPNNDFVSLMTLHAAKGLEFNSVLLVGIEDGILPSTPSLMSSESIEEERRLLYVGITRAREYLLMTFARYRYLYGTLTDQRPSRFIDELPYSVIQQEDCSRWNQPQISSYLSQWIQPGPTRIVTPVSAPQKPILVEKTSATWRPYQSVHHATFGIGIIQKIEERADATFLHVQFGSGLKKISAQFVQPAK